MNSKFQYQVQTGGAQPSSMPVRFSSATADISSSVAPGAQHQHDELSTTGGRTNKETVRATPSAAAKLSMSSMLSVRMSQGGSLKLDLPTRDPSAAQSAPRATGVARDTERSALPEDRLAPIPSDIAAPISGAALEEALGPYTQAVNTRYRFDHLNPIVDLLEHLADHEINLESGAQADDANALLARFLPTDPAEYFQRNGGGNCLHYAAFIAKNLSEQGLPAKVVPSAADDMSSEQGFNHAGVVVPFASVEDEADRGHVLIDRALGRVPFVVPLGGELEHQEGNTTLRLRSEQVDGHWQIHSERTRMVNDEAKVTTGRFLVDREWTNLAETAAVRTLVTDPAPRLDVQDEQGQTQAGVALSYHGNRMMIWLDGRRSKPLKFKEVLAKLDANEPLPIDDEFANALGEQGPALIAKLEKTMRASKMMKALRKRNG